MIFFLYMNICNELLKGRSWFQWVFFCISSSVHSGFLDPRGLGNSWHTKAALYWMTSDVFAVMTKWITTWVVWWALEENQLELSATNNPRLAENRLDITVWVIFLHFEPHYWILVINQVRVVILTLTSRLQGICARWHHLVLGGLIHSWN